MSSKRRKRERKDEVNTTIISKAPIKVKPRTPNQREFLKSIYTNDLTFCIGPAGTGKTHISVGVAIDLWQRKKVEKIVISRPVVEAGQKSGRSAIGYLPGDLDAKMAYYLRPLYDELSKFISFGVINQMKKENFLEICPLEFMRGRTFENCFVICDEAQNATEEQLEMLLTRLGNGSKMVVVGDVEQTDLPTNTAGGFSYFIEDLDGIEDLGIVELEPCDVARHPIVKAILERRKQIKQELQERPVGYVPTSKRT